MSTKLVAGIVAGIFGTFFLGYCVYFDRKRRSDPLFKEKLLESKFAVNSMFVVLQERHYIRLNLGKTTGRGGLHLRPHRRAGSYGSHCQTTDFKIAITSLIHRRAKRDTTYFSFELGPVCTAEAIICLLGFLPQCSANLHLNNDILVNRWFATNL